MEAFLFTVFVGAVVALVRSLYKGERSGKEDDLGLLSYLQERAPEPERGADRGRRNA